MSKQAAQPFTPENAILWLKAQAKYYDEQMHFLEGDACRAIIATIEQLQSATRPETGALLTPEVIVKERMARGIAKFAAAMGDSPCWPGSHDANCESVAVDIGVGEMHSPCGCEVRWYQRALRAVQPEGVVIDDQQRRILKRVIETWSSHSDLHSATHNEALALQRLLDGNRPQEGK